MNIDTVFPKNILVLNPDDEETSFLRGLCGESGSVYSAPNLAKAIALLSIISVNVLIVDESLGSYSKLRGLFKGYTALILTGGLKSELKRIANSWPADRYATIYLTSEAKADTLSFIRTVDTAMKHSQLIYEVQNLRFSIEKNDVELEEAFIQIKDIKNTVEKSIVTEMEKRIAMEAKYNGFRREKLKIETILKKLYAANDVTMLLDVVYDIKDLVQGSGITMYIMDESETTGKYLKPLVWDNHILSLSEFTKHIVLLDFQDFAAFVALNGEDILSADLSQDNRLSTRYLQHLEAPLENILCVPIKHDREVIGVLEIYNKFVNGKSLASGFTAEDQNIAHQICEHISIAINKLNLIQYDALTGLLRPDPFFDKVIQKIQSQNKRLREETSFSLVMGDVDWFKHYNDRNGHEAGNKLLRELAAVLKSSSREGDILCRYGGEEFLFFLSCKDCDHEAMLFTNRIRKNIENYYFDYQEHQPHKNLTMSFGITIFSRSRFDSLEGLSKEDIVSVINEADSAMAEAKGKRRAYIFPENITEETSAKNKICVFKPGAKKEPEFPKAIDVPEKTEVNGGEERRRYKRFDTSTYLIYKNGSQRKVIRASNMSLGGARLISDIEFQQGKAFELSLILGETVLECKGDVVYSTPYQDTKDFVTGVKFRDLSFNDWKILEQYFAALGREKSTSH